MPVTVRDFQIRDFQSEDFNSLWSIDQHCFPPGISYSRTELRSYMRRRGSFTLVAVNTASEAIADSGLRKNDLRKDDLRKNDKNSAAIARANPAIAGFIVTEAGRGAGHIITIDVIAAARRFGLGSLLLRGAEDRLRSAGCQSVELETAVDNVSALSFYKHHGYTVIGTFPRYYSNGVDALILQKALTPK
ncbi:MAG: GNAT family N-acetyltransferase [Candidatus Sulfotelmatobacter sp.]